MTYTHALAFEIEDQPSDLRAYAWLGPALGAGLLLVAYGAFFVPVFFGILSSVS